MMRWISADVSLPELGEDVLIWVIYGDNVEGEADVSWLELAEADRPGPNWATASTRAYRITHWARIVDPQDQGGQS